MKRYLQITLLFLTVIIPNRVGHACEDGHHAKGEKKTSNQSKQSDNKIKNELKLLSENLDKSLKRTRSNLSSSAQERSGKAPKTLN